ncbi:MAG: hypothetical protein ACOH2A_15415 [Sphingobacteriaceae bacterium]
MVLATVLRSALLLRLLKDLIDMKKSGFNWIRIWVNWLVFDADISAVDAQAIRKNLGQEVKKDHYGM